MILVVGASWFLSSAVFSTWANTTFLQFFKDPLLHTFIRFFGSSIFGSASLLFSGDVKSAEIPTLMFNVVVPGLLLWIANYANSFALKAAGITLTYVVKACIPVFTVIICKFQGQNYPILIYISLLPICLGVALASGSDLDFSLPGFIAALVSALAQTCMNISIKAVRSSTGYSGPKAFMGMAIVSTLATAPILLAMSGGNSATGGAGESNTVRPPSAISLMLTTYQQATKGEYWPLILLVLAAVAYHVEYALNFVFVGYVSSVAFSVSDIARRIAIIMTGAVVFNKSLTLMNWLGISVALSGVLWYSFLENHYASKAKQAAAAKDKETVVASSSGAATATAAPAAAAATAASTPKPDKPDKPEDSDPVIGLRQRPQQQKC